MCGICSDISSMFLNAVGDNVSEYIKIIDRLQIEYDSNHLWIIAGDCPLSDAAKYLENEEHYTISHYLQCRECSQYFFVGACIRGIPVYKLLETLDNENIESKLWGQFGKRFANL